MNCSYKCMMYACIHMYIYTDMCVCVCVHMHMYTHTHTEHEVQFPGCILFGSETDSLLVAQYSQVLS